MESNLPELEAAKVVISLREHFPFILKNLVQALNLTKKNLLPFLGRGLFADLNLEKRLSELIFCPN